MLLYKSPEDIIMHHLLTIHVIAHTGHLSATHGRIPVEALASQYSTYYSLHHWIGVWDGVSYILLFQHLHSLCHHRGWHNGAHHEWTLLFDTSPHQNPVDSVPAWVSFGWVPYWIHVCHKGLRPHNSVRSLTLPASSQSILRCASHIWWSASSRWWWNRPLVWFKVCNPFLWRRLNAFQSPLL